jgi:8-oxo-dGTP pyrophosphatase MutT (NUDIX family)
VRRISLDDFRSALAGRQAGPLGRYRYFSVLVPLVERGGELCVLFEARSDSLRRQPGETGFPGGSVEAGETPLECAVRETGEELGIPREDIEIIGELDYIRTYSDFTLYSFLGAVSEDACGALRLNPAEVKDVFLVPVSFFMESEPLVYRCDVVPAVGDDFPYGRIQQDGAYRWRSGSAVVPIYTFEGRAIWGLTARIVMNLAEMLRQPAPRAGGDNAGADGYFSQG